MSNKIKIQKVGKRVADKYLDDPANIGEVMEVPASISRALLAREGWQVLEETTTRPVPPRTLPKTTPAPRPPAPAMTNDSEIEGDDLPKSLVEEPLPEQTETESYEKFLESMDREALKQHATELGITFDTREATKSIIAKILNQ